MADFIQTGDLDALLAGRDGIHVMMEQAPDAD
jgi:hypothetical protein